MIDELMKPSEVASLLGVSRTWVYEAAACSRIPSVRLGDAGPVRFVRSELESWLREARREWSPAGGASGALRPVSAAPERRAA